MLYLLAFIIFCLLKSFNNLMGSWPLYSDWSWFSGGPLAIQSRPPSVSKILNQEHSSHTRQSLTVLHNVAPPHHPTSINFSRVSSPYVSTTFPTPLFIPFRGRQSSRTNWKNATKNINPRPPPSDGVSREDWIPYQFISATCCHCIRCSIVQLKGKKNTLSSSALL